MKIIHVYAMDFFFVVFSLVFGMCIGVGSVGYLLFALLIPHVLIIPVSFYYFTFFNILKSAGDDSAAIERYKVITVYVVVLVSTVLFFLFYFWKLNLWGEWEDNIMLCMIAISQSIGVSTTILAGLAAYRMFIRVSARGYKKLIK